MPTQNSDTEDTAAPDNMSKPGTPEWHYDEIMRWIEPDLLTHVLKTHDEKYKNETQQQMVSRMEHYDKAFAVFDAVVEKLTEEDRDDARQAAAAAHKIAHAAEEKEHSQEIQKAEENLTQ